MIVAETIDGPTYLDKREASNSGEKDDREATGAASAGQAVMVAGQVSVPADLDGGADSSRGGGATAVALAGQAATVQETIHALGVFITLSGNSEGVFLFLTAPKEGPLAR